MNNERILTSVITPDQRRVRVPYYDLEKCFKDELEALPIMQQFDYHDYKRGIPEELGVLTNYMVFELGYRLENYLLENVNNSYDFSEENKIYLEQKLYTLGLKAPGVGCQSFKNLLIQPELISENGFLTPAGNVIGWDLKTNANHYHVGNNIVHELIANSSEQCHYYNQFLGKQQRSRQISTNYLANNGYFPFESKNFDLYLEYEKGTKEQQAVMKKVKWLMR